METPKSHRRIEPHHDGQKEVGVIGGLARVDASGEPPVGLAKEEVLKAAGEKAAEPRDERDLDRGAA